MINGFSRVKEAVATWDEVRSLLRSGDAGQVVPVIIPRRERSFGWLLPAGLGFYMFGAGIFLGGGPLRLIAVSIGLILLGIAALAAWQRATIEIEQGTTGILSRYGEIIDALPAGRHYLWHPGEQIEFIVDTATDIPYRAPILACPTAENVPLKAIEFFLTFRIEDPVAFVQTIGASNFDMVLSAAVQDAIRQRSRTVRTERAYELRGSDVGDMQDALNKQLRRYGVRITGANIPDVQLPDQYQADLAMREQVAKEQAAYTREWQLRRRQQIDAMDIEIVRAEKLRAAKQVEVNTAINKAREAVARTIQERQAQAERVKLDVESEARASLTEAEHEARGMQQLAEAYADNQVVLDFELALDELRVAETLVNRAPRPVLVRLQGDNQSSPLAQLVLAQLLPRMLPNQQQANESVLANLLHPEKSNTK